MTPISFDNLLARIRPYVTHQRNHWCPISDSEHLAATLLYFATGTNPPAVAASYKLGSSTASQITCDVCQAIWDALKSEFVAFPSGTECLKITHDLISTRSKNVF